MTVTLYNYKGMDNVANKLLSRLCTKVWEGTITTYGAFTPRGGVFRLSDLYQCNYCTFKYDGITYYANVDVSTDSKGLYVYTCTTDSLATAYYKGCINSTQFYRRWSDWTNNSLPWRAGAHGRNLSYRMLKDDKVSLTNLNLQEVAIEIRNRTENNVFVVGIYEPYPNQYTIPSSTQNVSEHPAISVYALQSGTFDDFVNAFNTIDGSGYAETVAFIYYANADWIPGWQSCPSVSAISVYRPSVQYTYDDSGGQHEAGYDWERKDISLGGGNAYIINNRTAGQKFDVSLENFSVEYTDGINLNQGNMYVPQRIHIHDVGDINFTFAQVARGKSSEDTTISKIGYNVYYDFSDGKIIAYLRINEKIRREFSIVSRIPYSFALQTDGHITNFVALQGQVLSNTINSFTRLAMGDIGGAAVSAISGVNQLGQSISNENIANYSSSTNFIGNLASSIDRATHEGNIFYYKEMLTNQRYIYRRYGALLLEEANPTGSYGFYQTENANIPNNGLPNYIVRETNMRMDAGYIIAPNNANVDTYYNENFDPFAVHL